VFLRERRALGNTGFGQIPVFVQYFL
jgi:hypothetical protein